MYDVLLFTRLSMEVVMSAEARKAALERRHAAIETELQQLHNQPAADTLSAQALKRRKLQVKDELARMRS